MVIFWKRKNLVYTRNYRAGVMLVVMFGLSQNRGTFRWFVEENIPSQTTMDLRKADNFKEGRYRHGTFR